MSRAWYYYCMFEARALQGVNLVTFSDNEGFVKSYNSYSQTS